jgi:hypothetical protein
MLYVSRPSASGVSMVASARLVSRFSESITAHLPSQAKLLLLYVSVNVNHQFRYGIERSF